MVRCWIDSWQIWIQWNFKYAWHLSHTVSCGELGCVYCWLKNNCCIFHVWSLHVKDDALDDYFMHEFWFWTQLRPQLYLICGNYTFPFRDWAFPCKSQANHVKWNEKNYEHYKLFVLHDVRSLLRESWRDLDGTWCQLSATKLEISSRCWAISTG